MKRVKRSRQKSCRYAERNAGVCCKDGSLLSKFHGVFYVRAAEYAGLAVVIFLSGVSV
jgi:hypothetical protein